MSAAKLHMQP